MFIGRKNELKILEDLYQSNNFELMVMYGRRRVGKTTLISKFSENKKYIFFVAEEINEKLLLEKFSKVIAEYMNLSNLPLNFQSWESALEYLGELAQTERILLVLDEFPYMVNSKNGLLSTLQNLIDHKLRNSKLFIILCGSSISFMENEVLSHKSPIFGRRTAQMKVIAFDYYESSLFFKDYSNELKIITYSILGGIPHYLLKFDNQNELKINLEKNIFSRSSYLLDEPINLLKQELRNPTLYNSIIIAIANGETKLSKIATKVGETNSKVANYIKSLLELNIISKITPITEKSNSKKSIYQINDNFFKFYFKFVVDNMSLIEQGMGEYVVKEKVLTNINEFVGHIFEEICIQYLLRKNQNYELPFIIEKMGKWWGNNPIKKQQEEIDIVGIGNNQILFGECKFRNEKCSVSVFNKLIERSHLIKAEYRIYYIFSKSGFTDKLKQIAQKRDDLNLITLDELFNFAD
jgi:AAA+ ATPase superfamily predicted ATPase